MSMCTNICITAQNNLMFNINKEYKYMYKCEMSTVKFVFLVRVIDWGGFNAALTHNRYIMVN